MSNLYKPNFGLDEDPFKGWHAGNSFVDFATVIEYIPFTSDDATEELENSEFFDLLVKQLPKAARYLYLFTLQKLTGTGEQLTNVPYVFSTFSNQGTFNGSIPTKGQVVLVHYVGANRIPICTGGLNANILNAIATGKLPVLKPGEHFIQSEIDDNFIDINNISRKIGAHVYLDYKGRLRLKAVQNDGTIDGEVSITLGNPLPEDPMTDEDASFSEVDATTGKNIVFQLKTEAGITINIDSDGNVHSSVLKDYIKECVNEIVTNSGNFERSVTGYYQLTNSDIRIGGEDVDQSLVLGEILQAKLETLIDLIISSRHLHPQGPTIKLFPPHAIQFRQLKASLEDIQSHIAKTKRD